MADQSIEYQSYAVKRLALKLENLTIMKKGRVDVISDGQQGSSVHFGNKQPHGFL
jgi:hypothetical protein